jgi:hypothetical protein
MAETYASCIEQPVFRLFLALSASLNYLIFGGDAQDAFAHFPAPMVPTFVAIDEAYSDRYFDKYGICLKGGLVLPVLHAFTGDGKIRYRAPIPTRNVGIVTKILYLHLALSSWPYAE